MTDYLDGYGEGYYDDHFEDYENGEMEEYCPDEYVDDGYNESDDPEAHGIMDERSEKVAEGWITPFEASVLGYGFGLHDGLEERKRRKQLRQEARIRIFRRYRGW